MKCYKNGARVGEKKPGGREGASEKEPLRV